MGRPSLLSKLPLEIREQIYQESLVTTPSTSVQLLRVCRQIYEEAQPFIFKRPLAFASQSDLYQWLQTVGPQNLHHVTSLSLKLLDLDPDLCLRKKAHIQRRNTSMKDMGKSMYEEEIHRLLKALNSLQSVQSLTMYKPGALVSDPCRDLYLSFFALVARQYTQLKSLSFFMDQLPLTFLTSLKSLRCLRFTGFTTSSPAETLTVLQSLPLLREVELFGPPPGIAFQQRVGYAGAKRVQSVTSDVLLRLKPLRSFTICEIRDEISATPIFFTEPMLYALYKAHNASLERLRISLDFKPTESTIDALSSLISSCSSLRELDLGWPGLDGEMLECLPGSLRRLYLTASPDLEPEDAADNIIDLRGNLPLLTDVELRLDWRMFSQVTYIDKLYSKFDTAISRLKAVGIRGSHGWWHPIIFECTDASRNA